MLPLWALESKIMRDWVNVGAKTCHEETYSLSPTESWNSIGLFAYSITKLSCRYLERINSRAWSAEIRSDGLNFINPWITGRRGWSISSWTWCLNLYSSPRSTRRSPSIDILLLDTIHPPRPVGVVFKWAVQYVWQEFRSTDLEAAVF